MSGARITFTFKDAKVTAAFDRLHEVGLAAGTMRAIGMALVETTEERFRDGREPFGAAWQALTLAYAAMKRGPGILRESQMLMRSITFQTAGRDVIVGSNRVYAAVHQFGGVIKPKAARALVFRLGPKLVRAQSVRIPARPYLGFGPADQRAVMEVLEAMVASTLRS